MFDSLEIVLEFLKYVFCLLGDNSIDWGLNASHCLREKNLNAWIVSPVDDFALDINDRFEYFLDSFLRFHLIVG